MRRGLAWGLDGDWGGERAGTGRGLLVAVIPHPAGDSGERGWPRGDWAGNATPSRGDRRGDRAGTAPGNGAGTGRRLGSSVGKRCGERARHWRGVWEPLGTLPGSREGYLAALQPAPALSVLGVCFDRPSGVATVAGVTALVSRWVTASCEVHKRIHNQQVYGGDPNAMCAQARTRELTLPRLPIAITLGDNLPIGNRRAGTHLDPRTRRDGHASTPSIRPSQPAAATGHCAHTHPLSSPALRRPVPARSPRRAPQSPPQSPRVPCGSLSRSPLVGDRSPPRSPLHGRPFPAQSPPSPHPDPHSVPAPFPTQSPRRSPRGDGDNPHPIPTT